MIDHVGARTAHPERSLAFYDAVLSALGRTPTWREDPDAEWDAWCVSPVDAAHPVATTGLHVGFAAPSRAHVDAFHAAGLALGAPDDGAPGERDYLDGYYGAFLRDPDGNSAEAVHVPGHDDGPVVDHLWIGVADLDASVAFHALLAEHAGLAELPRARRPERATFGRGNRSYTLVADGRPVTRGLHLALPAPEEAVRAWHAAALAAGHRDNGAPGERPYHPGYYAAFVLDPDGGNVELVDHHR